MIPKRDPSDPVKRSRAYDAHMKNKLFDFRNGTNRTYDEKSW